MSFDRKNLGSLLREPLRNGKSARASKSGEGVPVFTLTAVTNADFSAENTKNSVMTEEQAEDVWAEPGDIFIERSNTPELVGTAALYNGPQRFAVFPDLLIRVRPVEDLNGRFLAYFLKSEEARRYFRREARGIAGSMPKISQGTVEGLAVPVPGLAVQKAIVAAIETQFSRLDAAVASLTRAKVNVQRARASVLKSAVEGRLVPTEAALARAEGRDYEPASALLARILTEREAAHEAAQEGAKRRKRYKPPVEPEREGLPALPEGWCCASTEGLTVAIVDCLHSTPKFGTGDFACLDTNAMGPGFIKRDRVRYVSREIFGERNRRLVPRPGDIVFAREGTVGDAVVLPPRPAYCLGQRTMLMRPAPEVSAAFVAFALMSPQIRRQYAKNIAGSTVAHVNMRDIRMFAFPVPPLPEQHRIAAEVDRRLSVLDAIDTTLDANLARCEHLRQSILKRAFEGRLVPAPRSPKVDASGNAEQLGLFDEASA